MNLPLTHKIFLVSLVLVFCPSLLIEADADDQCPGGVAPPQNLETQTQNQSQTQQTQTSGSQVSTNVIGSGLSTTSIAIQPTDTIQLQDPLIEGLDNVIISDNAVIQPPVPPTPQSQPPAPTTPPNVVNDSAQSYQSYREEKERRHRESAARWREEARKEREAAKSWWEWFVGFRDHHLRMANKWDDEARKEEWEAEKTRLGM